MTRKKLVSLVLIALLCTTLVGTPSFAQLPQATTVPLETDFSYEHVNPNYDQILYSELQGWLDDITKRSNRVSYKIIGTSAGGRNLYEVVVTEPSAQGKLGKYKSLRNVMMKDPAKAQEMMAQDPDFKVPIFINNSIHGGETTGVDASVKLIEELAFENTDEVNKILENTIIVFNLDSNPDGRANGWRQNDNGFDCNRDMATQSQPETKAILNIITEWKPMVTIDNHGYVYPILIEPCSMPHNPNYEEDLYQKWALDVALSMESTLKAQMPDKFPYAEIPFRDYNTEGGWDDYPAIFIPMFAQYYSLTGHTIEVGYRSYDGVLGHYWSNKAGLLFAAENRLAMFNDQLEMLERGTNYGGPQGGEFPKAYIIPADKSLQADTHEAAKTVEYLVQAGIEVEKAVQPFDFNGVTYPKGTYIVPMNQPLAGLANTLLWKGEDISENPGLPMYDISAWNFPELWGFNREIAQEELDVNTAPVNNADFPAGEVTDQQAPYYTLACDNNDAIRAVNQLLAEGAAVSQLQSPAGDLKAGTFVVQADKNTVPTLKSAAAQYGLTFTGIKKAPADTKALKKLKIAALTTYKGTRASANNSGTSKLYNIGPMAFVLRDLGFDIDVIWPKDIDQNGLEGYDIIVGMENVTASSFTGSGWQKLQSFFANNGKYVGYGSGGARFGNSLGILTNTSVQKRDNNGVVNVDFDTTSPVTGAYGAENTAFVYDPIYFKAYAADAQVLAKYDAENLFMAGFWPVAQRDGFAGSAAVIKNDKAVLFGLDPVFRAHIKGSFRLLANSIYNLTAE